MARKKVAAEPVLKRWAEVNEALVEVKALSARQAGEQAELDKEITAIRQGYEKILAERKARILRLEKDVQEYCELHKTEMEAEEKKRSRQLPGGVVGFRRSVELAALAKRTWKDVLAIVKAAGKRAERFIRTKEEINKDAVRAANLSAEKLEALGMRIREKDTFFYELELDETAATVPIDGQTAKKAG